MTKRILFLGGSGNISADCAALLAGQGHEVWVANRGRRPVPEGCRGIQAERQDAAALRRAASQTRPQVVLDFVAYELRDAQMAAEIFLGVEQYVFISSATVYEKPPCRLPIRESDPKGNRWWEYARKKLECERWLRDGPARADLPVTIVRPSHTYSRAWVPNPISSSSFTFAARLLAGQPVFVPDGGENPWTLTAASDFASGLAGLIGNSRALGEDFHITSDEVLTWNQIVAEIAVALEADAPQVLQVPADFICAHAPQLTGTLKGDKIHPGIFDNAKLKAAVPGFRCRKPFGVGVRESIGWLRAHPEQQNLNPQLDETIDQIARAWAARPG